MKQLATYLSLALLVFCGSALDSQGWAGYVAIGGVIISFGLMIVTLNVKRVKQKEQLKRAA